jgi:hypothetical protein
LRLGDLDKSIKLYQDALEIFESLGARDVIEMVEFNLNKALSRKRGYHPPNE